MLGAQQQFVGSEVRVELVKRFAYRKLLRFELQLLFGKLPLKQRVLASFLSLRSLASALACPAGFSSEKSHYRDLRGK